VGSQKDIEQEEDQGKGQVLGTVEGIYSRRRHLGESRESEECRGCIERI